MVQSKAVIPEFLTESSRNGTEISVTGKWVPLKKGGLFRTTEESREMIKEWEDIHAEAREHEGMLSTEINHAIGDDAVLVHHIFKDSESLKKYFSSTASDHAKALMSVAKPDIHLIRGIVVPNEVKDSFEDKGVDISIGEYSYGYVRDDYKRSDPSKAVQVTAKWTIKEGENIDELIHWWQRVATEAYSLEKGLIRFEVYRVIGEDALIIHETFIDSDELKFHLTKGTASMFKEEIDKVAYPENYFFRGPVSWTIRTYSKFMKLPATYSSQGSNFVIEGGTFSEGLF